jgi:hypothetical protein
MNLLKRFAVREGVTAEFRLDGIAITNTPHFTNPNLNINGTPFDRFEPEIIRSAMNPHISERKINDFRG